VVTLLDPRIAGPVASLWTTNLYSNGSSGHVRSSMDLGQRPQASTRFVLSKTEDAMDSVIPCVAEELFRPMMRSKFANPAQLQFKWCSP
jgi:hypothetical protein